jgi:NTP pyrophosphatase (non-canonical NTP hydrolase)
MDRLTFAELRGVNVPRCEAPDGFNHKLESWSPAEWSNAMAGECGEACNLTKKLLRGDGPEIERIGDEIADVVIYADLLAARLGLDLGEAIRRKFNATSRKRGYSVLLARGHQGGREMARVIPPDAGDGPFAGGGIVPPDDRSERERDVEAVMAEAAAHGMPLTLSRIQRRFGWGYTRARLALDAAGAKMETDLGR